jgi:GNAT superfamily N-acetyltransferase
VRIEHFEGLNRTPAIGIAVRGWHHMLEDGFASDTIAMAWDHNAFVAFDHYNQAVGVLTYAKIDHLKEWSICIGYVLPERRRTKVYTALWEALVERARTLGVSVITSSTAMHNASMRSAAFKQHRVEQAVVLEYRIRRPANV